MCVCSFSRSFSLYITFFKARRVEFAKSKKKNKKGYHSTKSNKISVIIDSKLFVINMTFWLIDKVKLNFQILFHLVYCNTC